MKQFILAVVVILMTTTISIAQPGFNSSNSYSEYSLNHFYDVVSQNNHIVGYGIARDSSQGFIQGVFFSMFDTLGNLEKKVFIKDSLNYELSNDWPSHRITATSDGGYIAVANVHSNEHRALLIKLDSTLNLEYQAYVGDTSFVTGKFVQAMEIEDGYLLFGRFLPEDEGYYSVVEKVDKQGKFIWRKRFGNEANKAEFIGRVYKTNRNTYIATGAKFLLPTYDYIEAWAWEVDADGNLLNEWTFSSSGIVQITVSDE